MLSELLLVLSGHPSSFFQPSPADRPTTLMVVPALSQHLHPGEEQSLNTLARLAFQYTRIRDWARNIQTAGRQAILDETLRTTSKSKDKGKGKASEPPDTYLATLAGGVLDILRDYEVLIDEAGFVPLSILLARFSPWQATLSALNDLVNTLSNSALAPTPASNATATATATATHTPGQLLGRLSDLTNNGNARLRDMFQYLYASVLRLFLMHLVTFLLSGIVPIVSTPTSPSIAIDNGPDPLSPQHRAYVLNTDLIPDGISAETRESILYVGRVAATLKREGRVLPKTMVDDLRSEIMGVEELDDGLERAVHRAREEVGEWLWKNVLTGPQVVDALESFGDYFLTRNGEYTVSLIREVDRLRMDKLILSNPHSSSSVIREQDLNLAILRASVGTSAETDRSIEKLRFKLDRGSLRPSMPSATSASAKHPSTTIHKDDPDGIRSLFSSFLLGAPMSMTTTMGWPMDLFITPPALASYIDINVYLTAIRDTHLKVLSCWSSLSASQRRRRKWTGSTEGGTRTEHDARQRLARSSWGLVRAMLFFLDQLLGHFMVDIIDVQHTRLLDRLEEVNLQAQAQAQGANKHSGGAGGIGGSSRPSSMRGFGAGARAASPGSHLGTGTGTGTSTMGGGAQSPSSRSRVRQTDSPAGSTQGGVDTQTIRSKPPPMSTKGNHANFLDFLSLRQMHSHHLLFLRQGLLIADRSTAIIIRDILDTCRRFTALVERWGGDVLPELLLESEGPGDGIGHLFDEREKAVMGITESLHELYSDFFRLLVDAQNPSSERDKDSSSGGASFSRTSRATQILQIQNSRVMSRQTSSAGSGAGVSGIGKKGVSKEMSDKAMAVDASMGRHLEQLLLRLDFNGVLTAWRQKEDEHGQTEQSVLAQGGL